MGKAIPQILYFPEPGTTQSQMLANLLTNFDGITLSADINCRGSYRAANAVAALEKSGWPIEKQFVDIDLVVVRVDRSNLPTSIRKFIPFFLSEVSLDGRSQE